MIGCISGPFGNSEGAFFMPSYHSGLGLSKWF
jgi:hypothetical protein